MNKIDSPSYSLHYITTIVSQTVNKIATNPSATNKLLQIINKIFAAIDLYQGKELQSRPITDATKGTVKLIDLYGSFRDLVFWINPFSKETIDQENLLDSLKTTLSASYKMDGSLSDQEELAKKIFKKVMKQSTYHSQEEVKRVIKGSLEKLNHVKAEEIANQIIIKQKKRPIIQLLAMACFSFLNISGNIKTLKQWGLLDLSRIASEIGNHSKILMFVREINLDKMLGPIASVGLLLIVSQATHQVGIAVLKYYRFNKPSSLIIPSVVRAEEKKQIHQELKNAAFTLASSSTELISVAIPLLFVLNPAIILALAILAKGTGLTIFMLKN